MSLVTTQYNRSPFYTVTRDDSKQSHGTTRYVECRTFRSGGPANREIVLSYHLKYWSVGEGTRIRGVRNFISDGNICDFLFTDSSGVIRRTWFRSPLFGETSQSASRSPFVNISMFTSSLHIASGKSIVVLRLDEWQWLYASYDGRRS